MKTSRFQIFALALFLVTALLLGGCGFTQAKKDAQAVVTRHFQCLATNVFDTAMIDYGAQFFQKTTKNEWR
jgi:hypothetical protein